MFILLHILIPLSTGVDCITEHAKFRIVCLDIDVLNTSLIGIHNGRIQNMDPGP